MTTETEQTTAPEAPPPEQADQPVEQATAPQETEETAQTPEGDEGGTEEQAKPRKPGKTERELRRLQRHVESLTQTLQNLSGGGHEAGKPQAAEPKPEAYTGGEYDPKYILERAKWELRQEREAETAKEAQRTVQERVTALHGKGAADFEDFAEVFDDTVPVSDAMAEAILESDIGHKVAYHLGQHPDEAARIARLSPVAAVKEIARIEAKLSAPPPPKKTTAAPPPPPMVTGRAPAAAQDPRKMTTEEYVRWRQAGNG